MKQFTDSQKNVIKSRNGSLLVSAAAGSGKTTVLVERIMEKIINHGSSINDFLIVTFTEAAAKEMKAKISKRLNAALTKDFTNIHLKKQLLLLNNSDIGTIDSFCNKLLRQNTHKFSLASNFRIMDRGEELILREQVLSDIIEKRYINVDIDKDFKALVDSIAIFRDDVKLNTLILELYDNIQAHPFPITWLKNHAENNLPIEESDYGRLILDHFSSSLKYIRKKYDDILNLFENFEHKNVYLPNIEADMRILDELSVSRNDWDEICNALKNIDFMTLRSVKGAAELPEVLALKATRETFKATLKNITSFFSITSDENNEDIKATTPVKRALISIVEDFSTELLKVKRKRNVLNFNDIEHFVVQLLSDGTNPTTLAHELSLLYEEIYVDEYQDTNELQNTIISCLSRCNNNLFLVGDIKQSIYGFRLASPDIFLEKYNTFPDYEDNIVGNRRILLSNNFRSRNEVVDSVNSVFTKLMTKEFSGFDYGDDEKLIASFQYEDTKCDYKTELYTLIKQSADEDGVKPDHVQYEASFVASKINELINSKMLINDEGNYRPIEYGDIVILMRSPSNRINFYIKALSENNIPYATNTEDSMLSSMEVTTVISFLSILDNPLQDIPLVSVLRCPCFNFSGDDLANIRLKDRNLSLFDALKIAAQDGDEKSVSFLDTYNKLRAESISVSLTQLVWDIYNTTGLYAMYGAMDFGSHRQRNLISFFELARRYETFGNRGLFKFVAYVNKLIDEEVSVFGSSAPAENNCVRIMSMHKSKGLEFPVVIISDLSKMFFNELSKSSVLVDKDYGIGLSRYDEVRHVEYKTLQSYAIELNKKKSSYAEELRLLYVAMTRAKEKLIMTSVVSENLIQKLDSYRSFDTIDSFAMLSCNKMIDWLLISSMENDSIRTLPIKEFSPVKRKSGGTKPVDSAVDEEAYDEIVRKLSYKYVHKTSTVIPAKLTATQLKGRYVDDEASENTSINQKSIIFDRPKFVTSSSNLTSAEKGTALHLAMQFIDFNKCNSIDEVCLELQRLLKMHILSKQQIDSINPQKIMNFFTSPLGLRFTAAGKTYREFKFSVLVNAKDYFADVNNDDKVLLQGVIDCFFEENDKIYIIDFKSDNVTSSTALKRVDTYKPQIEAYSKALSLSTGKEIGGKYLYFFAVDNFYEL